MFAIGSLSNGIRKCFSPRAVSSGVTKPIMPEVTALERSSGFDETLFRNTPLAKFYREHNLQAKSELKKFLKSHILPEKLLGEGQDYRVYDMGAYVLRVPKKPKTVIATYDNFSGLYQSLSGRNFGQPIADNPSGVQIARKVEGTPLLSGLGKNWLDCYTGKTPIGRKEANVYFEHLQQMAGLTDETLTQYVDDVSFLKKKGFRPDTVNPNNLLFDKETGRLNILDIEHRAPRSLSSSELVEPLVDDLCLDFYYKHLSPAQREQSMKIISDLYLRVAQISSKAGIEADVPPYVNTLMKEGSEFDYNDPTFRYTHK